MRVWVIRVGVTMSIPVQAGAVGALHAGSLEGALRRSAEIAVHGRLIDDRLFVAEADGVAILVGGLVIALRVDVAGGFGERQEREEVVVWVSGLNGSFGPGSIEKIFGDRTDAAGRDDVARERSPADSVVDFMLALNGS